MGSRFAAAALILAALAAPAQAQFVRPVDQAARDQALVKVRTAMIAAVHSRDLGAALVYVDEKIQINFGGEAGHAALTKALQDRPWLWDEWLWVLENGGKFETATAFNAPWTFNLDIGKRDPYETAVAPGPSAPAHARPDAASPILAQLGHRLVHVGDWSGSTEQDGPFYRRTGWIKVMLDDKRTAHVEARHLRPMVDYRAGFEKKAGQWKLTFFLSGD